MKPIIVGNVVMMMLSDTDRKKISDVTAMLTLIEKSSAVVPDSEDAELESIATHIGILVSRCHTKPVQ